MSLLGAAVAKQVEKLARKIAGRTKDQIVLEYARTAAQAELDLARVRRVKVSLIDRAFALGTLVPQPLLGSVKDIIRLMKSIERGEAPVFPRPIDHLATMPLPELQRSSEAVRRVLPELIKLERYERHAVAQRDRAIREMNLRCEEFLNSLKL